MNAAAVYRVRGLIGDLTFSVRGGDGRQQSYRKFHVA
jgi:hypothetical protein